MYFISCLKFIRSSDWTSWELCLETVKQATSTVRGEGLISTPNMINPVNTVQLSELWWKYSQYFSLHFLPQNISPTKDLIPCCKVPAWALMPKKSQMFSCVLLLCLFLLSLSLSFSLAFGCWKLWQCCASLYLHLHGSSMILCGG